MKFDKKSERERHPALADGKSARRESLAAGC